MGKRGKRPDSRRGHSLENDLDNLLGDLCVKYGFCTRLDPADLIRDGQVLTATKFAYAVIEAEGMTPETELTHMKNIERIFRKRYGESISENSYQPPIDAPFFG